MVNIYGIKTCSTVRKAIKFFKDNNIEHSFIDFRATPLQCSKIEYFTSKIDIDTLFNNRGQKYKDLNLKELNLDSDGKKEWLCKENMLLKRPVVEYDDKVIVSFKEDIYKDIFL